MLHILDLNVLDVEAGPWGLTCRSWRLGSSASLSCCAGTALLVSASLAELIPAILCCSTPDFLCLGLANAWMGWSCMVLDRGVICTLGLTCVPWYFPLVEYLLGTCDSVMLCCLFTILVPKWPTQAHTGVSFMRPVSVHRLLRFR